jgi:hypothetical protein
LVRRDVAADAERIRGDMRDLVARRYNAGLEPQASVEQAEGSVETARAELAAIDEAIALTRNALAALLGAGPAPGGECAAPRGFRRRAEVGHCRAPSQTGHQHERGKLSHIKSPDGNERYQRDRNVCVKTSHHVGT